MDNKSRQRLLKRLEKHHMTDFQTAVLKATADIPRGEVRTYKQIAVAIGHPNAYRAVGSALKRNPLAPDIPCHRVIRSDGRIGRYSGKGGMKGKAALLKREGFRNFA